MGKYLNRNPHKDYLFWEVPDLDPSDFVIAFAGDVCEGRIEPMDYLPLFPDFHRISLVRLAMLLRVPANEALDMSNEQIENSVEDLLGKYYPVYTPHSGNKRQKNYLLKLLVYPFSYYTPNPLEITHSRWSFQEMEELHWDGINILKKLMRELDIVGYAPFHPFRSWNIECPGEPREDLYSPFNEKLGEIKMETLVQEMMKVM